MKKLLPSLLALSFPLLCAGLPGPLPGASELLAYNDYKSDGTMETGEYYNFDYEPDERDPFPSLPPAYSRDDFDANAPEHRLADPDEEMSVWDGYVPASNVERELNRRDDFRVANTFAPNLPDLKAATLHGRVLEKNCALAHSVSVSYPTGTGYPLFDDYVKNEFEEAFFLKFMVEARRDLKMNYYTSCQMEHVSIILDDAKKITAFDAYSPRPGLLSLLTVSHSPAVAHPGQDYKSLNYDMADLRPLYLKDLFPDPKAGVAKLWPEMTRALCSQHAEPRRVKGVWYYGLDCESGGADGTFPLPVNLTKNDLSFDDLADGVVLTPEGLIFVLGPNNVGGHAMGPAYFTVPREAVLKAGASSFVWGK